MSSSKLSLSLPAAAAARRSTLRLSRRIFPRHASTAAAAATKLNSVTEADLTHFASILEPSSILSTIHSTSTSSNARQANDPSELDQYNLDWMGKYRGHSTTVLRPKTTEQVSKILEYCNERRIGVVPQGGNTGLVGGSVPVGNEVVINLGGMANIRSFDPVSGVLVADSGCILQSLSDHIAEHGHIMPLDLGAKGSCQIGGNVSTNAGGLRLLRYGSLHGTVLGLEIVLPTGQILSTLTTLRKDNTGYDLKQLFIGAEGTLGIVTGVSILTPSTPKSTSNVFLVVRKFEGVSKLFRVVRRELGEILSAFEFIDRRAYDLAVKHGRQPALPAEDTADAECFILVETSGSREDHDAEKLETLLDGLMGGEEGEGGEGLVMNGVISQSEGQFEQLWGLREGLTEAMGREGKAYKYDVSIPLEKFKEVVDRTREHLARKGLMWEEGSGEEGARGKVRHVVGYGHCGDGNLHLNVVAEVYTSEIESALEPFVFELIAEYKGSISAEHGIGAAKTHALHYSKGVVAIDWMHKIKNLFDPNGIMNPGKVLE